MFSISSDGITLNLSPGLLPVFSQSLLPEGETPKLLKGIISSL